MSGTATITQVWDETPEIRCFALRPNAGTQPFEPGAHIDMHLPGGMIRQYSLWNGQDRDTYLVGVKRQAEGRGGSEAMHTLQAGDQIEISAPRNNFALHEGPGPTLLLAGGIGITPLLSMARHLAAEGRDHRLCVFARGLDHVPFRTHLDDAGCYVNLPPAEAVTALDGLMQDPDPSAHVYLCGPGPFMDAAETAAMRAGWLSDHIHLERFSAEAPIRDADDTGFDVVLKSSGQTVHVSDDQTIVEALVAAGIDVLTSCEQGVCGACLTTVLDGTPEHYDQYLSAVEKAEGKSMMICVSRCASRRLLLDL